MPAPSTIMMEIQVVMGTRHAMLSFNFALNAGQGNCWLKAHQKIPFHSNETVDSAIFEVS